MVHEAGSREWRLGDLHHLGLTVADIERSIVFYRDVLGMTLHRRRPRVDNDYVARQTGFDKVALNVASFKVSPDSAQSLEIVQYMNHAGDPADAATNQPGVSHLCLTVDDLRGSPRHRRRERAVHVVFQLAAIATVVISLLIFFVLVRGAINFLSLIDWDLGKLSDTGWFPRRERVDLRTIIVGSVVMGSVAMLVAVPFGLAVAVYLSE